MDAGCRTQRKIKMAASKKPKGNMKSLAQQGRSGPDPGTFPGKAGGNRTSGTKFTKNTSSGPAQLGPNVIQTQIGRPGVNGNYKRNNAGNHDPGTPGTATGKALSNAKSCAKNNRSGGAGN